jgi:FxsC-like protein
LDYYFFFSYSRDNNDEYLRKFFDDLNKAVGEMIGEKTTGFIDQTGNEPGDFWESNLEAALAHSRVFLAIATASYCKKLYCGKEWAAFSHRLDRYVESNRFSDTPPLIIPLLWVPPAEEIAPFPQIIKDRHFHVGGPQLLANEKGLKYIVKNKALYSEEYENFISKLAERILSLAVEHVAFDIISSVPKFSEIDSPFINQNNSQITNVSVIQRGGGPKRVHFVYCACKPEEIKDKGRKSINAYGENGSGEWQPFYPEPSSIGILTQNVASTYDIGMMSSELSFSNDLSVKVRELEREHQLVVILVDCWTAGLSSYQKVLKAFDEQFYFNCCVLIPWNGNDPETKESEQMLISNIKEALARRYFNGNDLLLRSQIPSEKDLREQLADVLTRLRAEMINRSLPSPNKIPSGGGSRPQITGRGER